MDCRTGSFAHIGLVVAYLLGAMSAHAGTLVPPSGLQYVAIGTTDVPVAPGAQTTLTFEVVNDRPFDIPAGRIISTGLPLNDPGYSLAAAPGSACGAPTPPLPPTFPTIRFEASRPAIPAGTRIRCAYILSRSPTSNRVNAILFGELCVLSTQSIQLPCGPEFRVGTFGDIGLSYALTAPVPRGATSAIVRITATNEGTIAAGSVWFAACNDLPNQFRYGTDVPDACTLDIAYTPACFLSAVAWRVDAVPAGGQRSCQLRLVFGGPLLGSRSGFLLLQEARYAGNGTVWDTNRANDTLSIGVGPQEPNPVPLGWPALVVLLLATLATGAIAAARR
jgi:hypothetical protein